MSHRLDSEREARLQPQRMETAKREIEALGLTIVRETSTCLDFIFNGEKVRYFAYSGWATGKSIKDGRGLQNLLKQLK